MKCRFLVRRPGAAAHNGAHVASRALIGKNSVMISTGKNRQQTRREAIHQTVLLIDPPGPPAREFVLERLRLADPGKRRAQDVSDQRVDPRRKRGRNPAPALVVPVRLRRPLDADPSGLNRTALPASRSRNAFASCAALAGVLSRYSVSCHDAKSSIDISTAGAPFCRVITIGA